MVPYHICHHQRLQANHADSQSIPAVRISGHKVSSTSYWQPDSIAHILHFGVFTNHDHPTIQKRQKKSNLFFEMLQHTRDMIQDTGYTIIQQPQQAMLYALRFGLLYRLQRRVRRNRLRHLHH